MYTQAMMSFRCHLQIDTTGYRGGCRASPSHESQNRDSCDKKEVTRKQEYPCKRKLFSYHTFS